MTRTRRATAVKLLRVLSGLLGAGLASAACEPLEIPLFRATPDASVAPPVEVENPPKPVDAGAGDASIGVASADAAVPPDPCLPGATACTECVRSASCPAGRVCHPSSGACVVPCSPGVPACPARSTCSQLGVCVECVDRLQCTSVLALACDTERGVCVECVTSSDCSSNPVRYPICLASQRCGCATNTDCPGGRCETVEGHCEVDD